jgi:chorismate-pyruvate lyase
MLGTRFQRMLLGTDGTVTHILEAYADEAIDLVKLLQVFDTSNEADAGLQLAGEGLSPAKVLRRRVVLRGRRSQRSLLYAEAVVVVERVEPAFLEGLLGTDKPIGVLLAENRTETFREILRVSREPAGACAPSLGIDASSEVFSRTYRVVARRQPMILITEKFEADAFRELPA